MLDHLPIPIPNAFSKRRFACTLYKMRFIFLFRDFSPHSDRVSLSFHPASGLACDLSPVCVPARRNKNHIFFALSLPTPPPLPPPSMDPPDILRVSFELISPHFFCLHRWRLPLFIYSPLPSPSLNRSLLMNVWAPMPRTLNSRPVPFCPTSGGNAATSSLRRPLRHLPFLPPLFSRS